MANYFFMHNALVQVGEEKQVPTPDTIGMRNTEGHNDDKALRYWGFEDSYGDSHFVKHPLKSDTCLRFEKLATEGTIAVDDYFVLGLVPQLSELDILTVEQLNTVEGLQLEFTVLDHTFQPVEPEALVIDFTNAKVDDVWALQPVKSYNYDESGVNAKALRGEYFYLAAKVVALPVDWFVDCDGCCCPVPEFQVSVKYEDLCLMRGLDTCAPKDVVDAYNAAMTDPVTGFNVNNTIHIFDDIKVDKESSFR